MFFQLDTLCEPTTSLYFVLDFIIMALLDLRIIRKMVKIKMCLD